MFGICWVAPHLADMTTAQSEFTWPGTSSIWCFGEIRDIHSIDSSIWMVLTEKWETFNQFILTI
jgi:hypothetical protein